MTYVTLPEAQQQLPDLIAATQRGEEGVITDGETPLATLQASGKRARLFGALKGKITIADDFDEPLEDFAEYM